MASPTMAGLSQKCGVNKSGGGEGPLRHLSKRNTNEKCNGPNLLDIYNGQLGSGSSTYYLMYSLGSPLPLAAGEPGDCAILSVYRYLFLLFCMLNDFLSALLWQDRKAAAVRDLYAKCSELFSSSIFFLLLVATLSGRVNKAQQAGGIVKVTWLPAESQSPKSQGAI